MGSPKGSAKCPHILISREYLWATTPNVALKIRCEQSSERCWLFEVSEESLSPQKWSCKKFQLCCWSNTAASEGDVSGFRTVRVQRTWLFSSGLALTKSVVCPREIWIFEYILADELLQTRRKSLSWEGDLKAMHRPNPTTVVEMNILLPRHMALSNGSTLAGSRLAALVFVFRVPIPSHFRGLNKSHWTTMTPHVLCVASCLPFPSNKCFRFLAAIVALQQEWYGFAVLLFL